MATEYEVKAALATVQGQIVKATAILAHLEGQRDKLLDALLDSDGLHDRQPVGVR